MQRNAEVGQRATVDVVMVAKKFKFEWVLNAAVGIEHNIVQEFGARIAPALLGAASNSN